MTAATNQSAESLKPARLRHVRHRKFKGLERTGAQSPDSDPGHPRLKKLGAYLQERELTLDSTVDVRAFSVSDASTDVLSSSTHGFTTGAGPYMVATDGTLPGGLDETTEYYVGVNDADEFELFTRREDAVSFDENERVDITSNGSGNHTIFAVADLDGILHQLEEAGLSWEELRDATDFDDIVK